MYFTVLDAATHKPMSGAAVYAWHCNRDGGYSLYSSGLEDENYLRGVQPTNASGTCRSTDNVFRDGWALETPAVVGNVTNGYTVALSVAVNS